MISKDDLVDFEALKLLLGYDDDRSIKKWCKMNKIPLIKLGSKVYVLLKSISQNIDNQLLIFVKPSLDDLLRSKIESPKKQEIKSSSEPAQTEKQSEVARKFLAKLKGK